MTQDEIIRMGWECGIDVSLNKSSEVWAIDLETFAALVAAHEREACAKLCDEMAAQDRVTNYYKVAAAAIRARGEK